MRIRLLLILAYLSLGQIIYAQNKIRVTSFSKLDMDLAARTQSREDVNGEPCALIKVVNASQEYDFEGSIIDKEFKNGEIWLYVPQGTKRIVIKRNSNTERYPFPEKIEYATYELRLEGDDGYRKGAAFITSAVIPGLGQTAFKRSYGKGIAIMVGEVTSLGGMLVMDNMRSDYVNKSNMSTNAEDKVNFMKQADTYGTTRNICLGVAAAIYIYNIVDVIAAPAKKKKNNDLISFQPYFDLNSNMGVSLALNF